MFDFLKNWASGLASIPGTIFDNVKSALSPQPQQQQIISPLPDQRNYSSNQSMQSGPMSTQSYPIQSLSDGRILWSDGSSTWPMSTNAGEVSNQPVNYNSPEAQATVDKYGGIKDVSSLINSIVDPVSQAMEKWYQRLDEFDKNNPFAFDEAQAKASAAERLNPYYNATLNEFMTGIRRSSARSLEDMTRTVGELNVDAAKLSDQERLKTQEAIRQSQEGFAGSGLFFSGQNQRQTGLQTVAGNQTQEGIQTNLERNTAAQQRLNTRTQEDLALQEARQKRLTEAERTTALEQDVAKQQREAEIRHAQEKYAYAGPAPGSSFTNQFSTQNQLFGLY